VAEAPHHPIGFSVGVIYQVEDETIYILAVTHTKREPFYWEERN